MCNEIQILDCTLAVSYLHQGTFSKSILKLKVVPILLDLAETLKNSGSVDFCFDKD